MGVFDFLKGKEIREIADLQQKIQEANVTISNQNNDINALKEQIDALSKYQGIADIEKEANRIKEDALRQASKLITDAQTRSIEINEKADSILKAADQKEKNATIQYAEKIFEANTTASRTIKEATEQSEKEVKEAKFAAYKLKKQATEILDNATVQASEIINTAEKRAEEIAGEAYKAQKEEKNLTRTIVALKNTIKGYGDEYLIPTYSILDKLADDFGYTEAGEELKKARALTRLIMKNNKAAKCDYVEDYRKTTAINFTTDAFNGKVDTILASVKQDNIGILQQKITDAYHLVNNLGKAFRNAVITKEYLDARLDELKWAIITIQLRNEEREEQRRIKEQIREEEKAKREFEKALRDAEKEEDIIRKTLEKARIELETASESQKLKFEQKLAELEAKLKIAEEKGQRALSMAQQTLSGHVYIISNVGSFGENVYKIGMTRRLEPLDRVKELGDASVPFYFDVHAMIYSENAPSLEKDLHRYFVDDRVNKVNRRKEFFNVGISDIRKHVESLKLNTTWTMIADATEYRESVVISKDIAESGIKKEEWLKTQLR